MDLYKHRKVNNNERKEAVNTSQTRQAKNLQKKLEKIVTERYPEIETLEPRMSFKAVMADEISPRFQT